MTERLADGGGIRRAFEVQAEHCAKMGAPFNARVCRALVEVLDDTTGLGRRVLAWPKETRANDLVPLRCCAGLHALARAGRVAELAAVYPPHTGDERALRDAVAAAVAAEDAFLTKYLDSAPQTNEVGRSAILLGGLLTLQPARPVALFEVGASAGLNMQFDRWRYHLGPAGTWGDPDSPVSVRCDWTGTPPSLETPLRVVSRAASDLAPLDPAAPGDRERLLSYIWPDQAERLARTAAALDIAAGSDLRVAKADARDWVARELAPERAPPDALTVLFHSVFIQYLDPPVREALISDITGRGAKATDDTPFAWLRMEANEQDRARCELRATRWPGGRDEHLADVDWHGRSAHWG